MDTRSIDVDGVTVRVGITGPEHGPAALLLLGAHAARTPARTDPALIDRLVASGLRCVLVEPNPQMTVDTVPGLIDALGLGWVHLVGLGGGADLAWLVAARHLHRVSSLVVVDRVHPAAAPGGADRAELLPPVEVATTVVALDPAVRSAAYAAGRHVYADYRVVEIAQEPVDLAAVLATEVVLRSDPW